MRAAFIQINTCSNVIAYRLPAMSKSQFDPDLIRRNNINGPRYTSYPTADQFRDGEWAEAYKQSIVTTDIRALSLYMHIPFCSTICYYCACNNPSMTSQSAGRHSAFARNR